MLKSFDDLIGFLLDQIALCGEGGMTLAWSLFLLHARLRMFLLPILPADFSVLAAILWPYSSFHHIFPMTHCSGAPLVLDRTSLIL